MPTSSEPMPRPPVHDFAPDSLEAQLFERLRQDRRRLAIDHGVPPYHVLSDRDLADFVAVRPANAEVLACVRGIGPARAVTWGPALLDLMARHAAELGLTLTNAVPPERTPPRRPAPDGARQIEKRQAVQREAKAAFARGEALGNLCVRLDRAPSTLAALLAEHLIEQRAVSLMPWVDDATRDRVLAAADALGFEAPAPVHAALGGNVPMCLVRLVQDWWLGRQNQ